MHKPLLALVLSVMVSSPGECARRKVPDSSTAAPPRFATLRVSQPSFLIGGRGGTREVRYLSVRVSNTGDVVAKDVLVVVEGPSGLSFPLRGPKRLAPRAQGVYVSTVRLPAGLSLQPHAIVTCSSCRR